jgi:WD40 repeat protein
VCKATLTSDDGIQTFHFACAWGKGNRVIAMVSCSGDLEPRVDLWNVSTGLVESTFTVRGTETVGHVSFSPCGRWIATAGERGEGAIAIWSASTGAKAATMHVDHYVSRCPFSPDGTMLAAVTGQGSLYLWMLVWTPANHGRFPAEVRECVLAAVQSLRRKGLHLVGRAQETILRFAFSTLL